MLESQWHPLSRAVKGRKQDIVYDWWTAEGILIGVHKHLTKRLDSRPGNRII